MRQLQQPRSNLRNFHWHLRHPSYPKPQICFFHLSFARPGISFRTLLVFFCILTWAPLVMVNEKLSRSSDRSCSKYCPASHLVFWWSNSILIFQLRGFSQLMLISLKHDSHLDCIRVVRQPHTPHPKSRNPTLGSEPPRFIRDFWLALVLKYVWSYLKQFPSSLTFVPLQYCIL